jgi:hypothetical protein
MSGFLFLICREDDEKYRNSRAGEDMCGLPGNFNFYEIVRTGNFNISQHLQFFSSQLTLQFALCFKFEFTELCGSSTF